MSDYYIRERVAPEEISFRSNNYDSSQLSKIRSGLRKLHSFEIMAVNIYKYQITSAQDDLNRLVIQAMANEMSHVQDFQIKLYEFGSKPSPTCWAFWLAGMLIGFATRLLGPTAIVRAGIWTEQKAVIDYQKIINSAPWDTATMAVIQRNLKDEYHHIESLQLNLPQK